MLTPEDRAMRDAQREALKAYWRSNRDKPFILDRHESYYIGEVLFPSVLDHLRWPLRGLMVGLVNLLPISFLKVPLYRLLGVKIGKGSVSPRVS